MILVENIFWNDIGMTDSARPPAIVAEFHPYDVAVVHNLLTLSATVAIEAMVWIDSVVKNILFQAFWVVGTWTAIAQQQLAT